MEILETLGSTPQSRFGHTMTLVTETKAVLFGGATGDTGKYSITGETYSFDLLTRIWRKIEGTNSLDVKVSNSIKLLETLLHPEQLMLVLQLKDFSW